MTATIQAVAGYMAIAGAALIAVAGFGVVRMPDLYARMHAATKANTLGIGFVAVAVALGVDDAAAKVLLAAAAIFVTAPSAAHLIGRAAHQAEGVELRLDGEDELDKA